MLMALLKLLVLPPACVFLLLGLGLCVWRRRPRLGKVLCGGALCLLFLLSTGVGSWLLVHPLESLEPALPEGPAASAQAIVVLAAGRIRNSPEYRRQPVPDFTALERITYAAHLYRAPATRLPLLLSGGLVAGNGAGVDEPLALGMRRVLENEFRIPVQWVETASRTTAENAQFSARMLKQGGIGHILLVTDAVHMRRARRAFERQGLVVTPAPTFYLEPGRFEPLRLMPAVENLRRSHAALYEWCGLVWYALAEQ